MVEYKQVAPLGSAYAGLDNYDMPCSVCQTPGRGWSVMVPGRNDCVAVPPACTGTADDAATTPDCTAAFTAAFPDTSAASCAAGCSYVAAISTLVLDYSGYLMSEKYNQHNMYDKV